MDKRTPAQEKKGGTKTVVPRVVRRARSTGPEAARNLATILKDINAEMRRKGMTAQDARELRKWLRDG